MVQNSVGKWRCSIIEDKENETYAKKGSRICIQIMFWKQTLFEIEKKVGENMLYPKFDMSCAFKKRKVTFLIIIIIFTKKMCLL